MARGRFLDKRITQDMRFTRVSTTAYLVYLCGIGLGAPEGTY